MRPAPRPEARHDYQADHQRMPGRHELATSRLSWLAIISTCLAKIRQLGPRPPGTVVWEGYLASKARHGDSYRRCRQPAAHRRLQFLDFEQRRHETQ